MEQPTSLPSYIFMPKPIEQQLTAYQLGTLLEVYQWGWKRGQKGDRGPSKLSALLFAIGGIVGFIASIVGIINVIQSTGIFVFSIALIPLIPAFFAIVGIVALFQTSLCVAAFSEGIAYAKGTNVKVLHWHEIESCEQKRIKSWYGIVYYSYAIYAHNGKSLEFKAMPPQGESLGKIIQKNII